jgi:hypothetical protein
VEAELTLTLRDGEPFAQRVLIPRSGLWCCPSCSFNRVFSTAQGALNGAALHMMTVHRVKLVLPKGN